MTTTGWVSVIVVLLVLIGVGWWWVDSHSMMASPAAVQTPAQSLNATSSSATGANSAPTGVVSVSDNASLGNLLVGENGMTLYTYSPDQQSPGASSCTGQCAVNWPPYTLAAGTQLSSIAGLTGTLATIARADGTAQVTYNGAPLYFYVKDTAPGQANGQGVGGVWYVATP